MHLTADFASHVTCETGAVPQPSTLSPKPSAVSPRSWVRPRSPSTTTGKSTTATTKSWVTPTAVASTTRYTSAHEPHAPTPKPRTLNPESQSLTSKPQTPNPTPLDPDPKPQIQTQQNVSPLSATLWPELARWDLLLRAIISAPRCGIVQRCVHELDPCRNADPPPRCHAVAFSGQPCRRGSPLTRSRLRHHQVNYLNPRAQFTGSYAESKPTRAFSRNASQLAGHNDLICEIPVWEFPETGTEVTLVTNSSRFQPLASKP